VSAYYLILRQTPEVVPRQAIIQLWTNAREEFIPFLGYDVEIRKIICITNAIESLNARYRRAVKVLGHFPTEQAALNCLYLVTRSLDSTTKAVHDGQSDGASPQRVRHHLRRPLASGRTLLMTTTRNTVPVTGPPRRLPWLGTGLG
jgi:hypothetical protein